MNSVQILKTVKELLKKKRVTYSQLAGHLEISEAGVKKMFQAGDVSVGRILAICEFLEIQLSHLVELAGQQVVEKVEFNQEQQEFFTKNPSFFFFYLKLVYEGQTPEEIKQEFSLSDRALWRYLKKLDDLRLIELTGEKKVNFTFSHLRAIKTEGRVFEKMKSDLAVSFVHRIFESNNSERNVVMMSSYTLSEKNISELKKEFLNLIESYQKKSEMERTGIDKESLKRFSLLFGFADLSFISGITEV